MGPYFGQQPVNGGLPPAPPHFVLPPPGFTQGNRGGAITHLVEPRFQNPQGGQPFGGGTRGMRARELPLEMPPFPYVDPTRPYGPLPVLAAPRPPHGGGMQLGHTETESQRGIFVVAAYSPQQNLPGWGRRQVGYGPAHSNTAVQTLHGHQGMQHTQAQGAWNGYPPPQAAAPGNSARHNQRIQQPQHFQQFPDRQESRRVGGGPDLRRVQNFQTTAVRTQNNPPPGNADVHIVTPPAAVRSQVINHTQSRNADVHVVTPPAAVRPQRVGLSLRSDLTPVDASTAVVMLSRKYVLPPPDKRESGQVGHYSATCAIRPPNFAETFLTPASPADAQHPLTIHFSGIMRMNAAPEVAFQQGVEQLGGPYFAQHVVIRGVRTDNLQSLFYLPGNSPRFESLRRLELQQLEWSPERDYPREQNGRRHINERMLTVLRPWLTLDRLVIDFAMRPIHPDHFTPAASSGSPVPTEDTSISFIEMFRAGMLQLSRQGLVSDLQTILLRLPSAATAPVTVVLRDQLSALMRVPVLSQLQSLQVSRGQYVIINLAGSQNGPSLR